jgi:hypothetical protein
MGNTLYGARVYLELGRRFAHGHATRQGRPHTLSQLVRDRRPAKSFTFTLGPLEASADVLLNYRVFELGKDTEHLKHSLAGRRGGVETLLMQKQVDAAQAIDVQAITTSNWRLVASRHSASNAGRPLRPLPPLMP